MFKGKFILVLLLITSVLVNAQEFKRQLEWSNVKDMTGLSIPFCKNCDLDLNPETKYISFYNERIKGFRHEVMEVQIVDEIYSRLDVSSSIKDSLLSKLSRNSHSVITTTQHESGIPFLFVRIKVLRAKGNIIEKLESFTIKLVERTTPLSSPIINRPGRRTSWPSVSVLSSGQWFRVAVDKEGIYRMNKAFLESIGMSLSGVDPRTIKIFSGHGDILSELNADERAKDLQENAIFVFGEQDGNFDASDYILFYGQAPSKFVYDTTSNNYKYKKHYYAKETIYFITFGGVNGKRITTNSANNSQTADIEITDFDDVHRHEQDLVNHIKSGKLWYGEHFDRILNHSIIHTFPNRVPNSPVTLRTVLVARSTTNSQFTLNLNGNIETVPIASLSVLDYSEPFIQEPTLSTRLFSNVSGNTINLSISYNKPLSTSEGWIDYIELYAKRQLTHSGLQTVFANFSTTVVTNSRFRLSGSESVQVWDVTDPFELKLQNTVFNNNEHVFVANTVGKLRKFISLTSFLTPKPLTRINNQNIHGVRDIDYVIVTSEELKSSAENLAQFHREKSGLTVFVATTREIYNEFSHGIQDVTAIRDFVKMIWDEASTPSKRIKYLLLFGDASYDYFNVVTSNTNIVPTFQSLNSHVPNTSFCTDDYFVLMDEEEGRMDNISNIGMLDISVGRLTVANVNQANSVINKIKNYYSVESFGNWRNEYTLIADDMDDSWESTFVLGNEEFADLILEKYPFAIFNKIYLDAYEQKSLGGGERYPDAVDAINNGIEKGTLFWSYNGHGGTFGLASERVIEIPQINSWKNRYALPLFLTATCEFSRYDDPGMLSGGENVLLNPNGGGIGLLTTTRLIFVSTNNALLDQFYKNSFYVRDENNLAPIGLLYKATKNRSSPGSQDRFFTLLGDPALKLAKPRYSIVLDSLNSKAFNDGGVDTLKALSKVTFKGRVLNDDNSTRTNFNGLVYPTVLDKPTTVQTRANDPAAVQLDIKVESNILFRGRSQAVNGRFEFTFIVPKDINYRFDTSRISMYAENQVIDAAGFENRIVVGGSADSVGFDDKGPQIELFMNDYTFVNGGMTNSGPLFIATLFDESGINTAGSGIGRELIATLDKGTKDERTIVLNEFYQASIDSYQEGEIRYRLSGLSEGKHTITLKAWDVHNNSQEATLEFIVEESGDLVLRNVLNYPNPFSTRTQFHFDHNKPGQDLTVHIQIMTIGGRVIKTHFSDIPAAESHLVPFEWDARDEFGDKLARGVYVYRIRARATDGEWVEKYEKLLILN